MKRDLGLGLAVAVAGLALCAAPASRAAPDADASSSTARPETFHSTMDQVFGPGRWRETSGYRSRAREDQLRREGAGTVAPGHLSRHSIGTPDAPGAYDAVAPGLSVQAAAAKLRGAGGGITRVLAEAAHGNQGPHLHIELARAGSASAAASPATAEPADDTIYLRIVSGRRNPVLQRTRR